MAVIFILGIILLAAYILYKKKCKRDQNADLFYQEIIRMGGNMPAEDEGCISSDHKLKVKYTISSMLESGEPRKYIENVSFAEAYSFALDQNDFEDLSASGLIRFNMIIDGTNYAVMIHKPESTLRQYRGSTFEVRSEDELKEYYNQLS